MMNEKDKLIFGLLRNNSRMNFTEISDRTGIPVSTIYDRVKANEKNLVKKHSMLVDFTKLGYHAKAQVALKVSYEQREALCDFLKAHPNVNSMYRINYGYDYLIEVVFLDISHVERFIDQLDSSFTISQKHVFNILEDIKREEFWK